MARKLFIFIEDDAGKHEIGIAYFNGFGRNLSTTFTYSDEWFSYKNSFAVDPQMPLQNRSNTVKGLPGFLSDITPDRWGRTLVEKSLRAQANLPSGSVSIDEYDYLLNVSDISRMGAYRVAESKDGPYLQVGNNIPKLIDLPALVDASFAVEKADDWNNVKSLLDAGTSSLGGAHPKATVADKDKLYIAKFPKHSDVIDGPRWEYQTMLVAQACGLDVMPARLIELVDISVFLTERFDRTDGQRIPYMSGMTLLGTSDYQINDYLDLSDVITSLSSNPNSDKVELYKRVLFNVAVHNVDDHQRNHGLLHIDGGWRLSPAFDINPNFNLEEERRMSIFAKTGIEEAAGLSDLGRAMGLTDVELSQCIEEVVEGMESWKELAVKCGCKESEINLFEPVIINRIEAIKAASNKLFPGLDNEFVKNYRSRADTHNSKLHKQAVQKNKSL